MGRLADALARHYRCEAHWDSLAHGLGLVFATQAPKGLHNRIPGNATTQFFGLLNAPAQIAAAQEMAAQKGGDARSIARLRPGEFFVGSDMVPFQRVRSPMCLSHHHGAR